MMRYLLSVNLIELNDHDDVVSITELSSVVPSETYVCPRCETRVARMAMLTDGDSVLFGHDDDCTA